VKPPQILVLALALLLAVSGWTAESLPWEKDYATALAKAKAEKRPLFLMLTATWCGPCKMLERQTLPERSIRDGLKEFVWVQAFEDEALNKKFNLGGYPTLVFLDSATERVLARTSGYQTPRPFLRNIIAARKAGGLPLGKEMQDIVAKTFAPDRARIMELVTGGNLEELMKYLAPAQNDPYRENNFFVAKVIPPPGISTAELVVRARTDEVVPESGVFLVPIPRDAGDARFTVIAPGCKSVSEPLRFEPNTAVASREFKLQRLTPKAAARFSGRVLLPIGKPASNAIVRICDWGVERTDGDGRFQFESVSPGNFEVRAEYPGGEFQEQLDFASGQEMKRDLRLEAMTTVGIRWAVQTKEGSRELAGPGVRTGEACFSVKHSRFLLERGAEVRVYWGSDFMLKDNWESVRQYIKQPQLAALEAAGPDAPVFWLFDATDHPTGLHAEQARFDDILRVNNGQPFDEKSYFKFLRGDLVRKGDVYTLRGVRKDCYAKMEITDVTIVPKKQ
jgi:thiol-disulfide isomerase/thioredoxin